MPPENNPLQTPAPPQNPSSPLKQIRTFQGDVASALGKQKESLFSIQQTEKLKQSAGFSVPTAPPPDNSKRKELLLLTFGSAAFIILGAVGAWFGYREFMKRATPPVIAVPETRFITVQKSLEFNTASTSRDVLFADLATKSAEIKEDDTLHFILRKGVGELMPLTTSSEFFTYLGTTAPGTLVRAFDPLFMLGSIGNKRFLIIKLSSFESAFGGMLAWEKTMAQDLSGLFGTGALVKNLSGESVFKDVISKNKDVRLLSAPASLGSTSTETALLYSFFDNKMVIITESLDTMQILVDRLTQKLFTR